MLEVVKHPNAALFENPEDSSYLLALDLEDPTVSWLWPNRPDGWGLRKRAPDSPIDLNAKSLSPEFGLYSGWPGCRALTPAECAERRAEKRRLAAAEKRKQRGETRPAHRPSLAYDQKVAHVHLRATNGDVLRWGRAAAIVGVTLEDWLLEILRGAVEGQIGA